MVIVLMITALSDAAFCYAESDVITYYETREEAAAALREAMKAREKNVTVAVYERADEESIREIMTDILDTAIEHTGDPREGDYLKFQFADYTARSASGLHWGRPAVKIDFDINYYTDAAQEKLTDKKVKEIIESLDLNGRSDYRKIKLIHDYVCENVEYDSESAGNEKGGTEHTAYGALVEGKAVCQGYSVALYRLLLEAGVDCRIINGTGVERSGMTGSHSWNIAGIGGVYFYVDSTWDDSTGSLEYFLRNRDGFEKDHIMSDEFGESFVTKEYPVSRSGYPADFDTPAKAILKAAAGFSDALEPAEAA